MFKKIVILLLMLALPALSLGQEREPSTHSPLSPTQSRSLGWLNPKRLFMTQSYSLFLYSGNGGKGLEGLYLNTLAYRFSRPLSLEIRLGHLHGTFLPTPFSSSSRDDLLLGTRLTYQPSRNVILTLEYNRFPPFTQFPPWTWWGVR